jgi:hypothetical protein
MRTSTVFWILWGMLCVVVGLANLGVERMRTGHAVDEMLKVLPDNLTQRLEQLETDVFNLKERVK